MESCDTMANEILVTVQVVCSSDAIYHENMWPENFVLKSIIVPLSHSTFRNGNNRGGRQLQAACQGRRKVGLGSSLKGCVRQLVKYVEMLGQGVVR